MNTTANDTANATPIAKVKSGEFFKRKADAKTVYVRGEYDRASKSFSATDFYDTNKEIFIKANKVVFVGFTF